MANANLTYKSGTRPNVWEFNFQANLVKTRNANFHQYSWSPDVFQFDYGAAVKEFGKQPITYKATIAITGSETSKRAWLDEFHLACDLDILNRTPGKLYWGSMYIECYIVETSTEPGDVYADNEIGIFCPYPSWIYAETYARSTFAEQELKYMLQNLGDTGDIVITDATYIPAALLPMRQNFRAILIGDGTANAAYMRIKGLDNVNNKVEMDFPSLTLASGQALVVDGRYDRKTAETYTVVDYGNWPSQVPYINLSTRVNVYDKRAANSHMFKSIKLDGYTTPKFDLKDCYSNNGAHMIVTVYYERSEPTWIS